MSVSNPDNTRGDRARALALANYNRSTLAVFDRREPDIVITDIVLTKSDTLDFLEIMRGTYAASPASSLRERSEEAKVYLRASNTPAPIMQHESNNQYSKLANAVEDVLRHNPACPNLSVLL